MPQVDLLLFMKIMSAPYYATWDALGAKRIKIFRDQQYPR